jgi:transcriptional regulator with XRE-family HTH domain
MSPFSHELYALRMRYKVRQSDLADLLGYEQSYISAVESGLRSPPTREFVDALVSKLELPIEDEAKIRRAAKASERKLILDTDTSAEIFWLLAELREALPNLDADRVTLIRNVLHLDTSPKAAEPEPIRRLKRRNKTEAAM